MTYNISALFFVLANLTAKENAMDENYGVERRIGPWKEMTATIATLGFLAGLAYVGYLVISYLL